MSQYPGLVSSLGRRGSSFLDQLSTGGSPVGPMNYYGFPSQFPLETGTASSVFGGTTGTATYPVTTFTPSSSSQLPTLYPTTSSPTYSSVGSFSVQGSSPVATQTYYSPVLDTKDYGYVPQPTKFSLPPPATGSYGTSPRGLALPAGYVILPNGDIVRETSGSPSVFTSTSPPRSPTVAPSVFTSPRSQPFTTFGTAGGSSPVKGLWTPTSSPKKMGTDVKRAIENKDLSEWGVNFTPFNVNILPLYKDRFLLIYKKPNGKYRAVWAKGNLLRGDQLLSTVKETTVDSIARSPIVEGYPFDLTAEPINASVRDGNVVAAITSLDEPSALKYVSIGDYSPNLSDIIDYFKISRAIGDKTLVDALLDQLIGIAALETSAFEIEYENTVKKVLAGIRVEEGLVSRIPGEKVNIPDSYVLPYTRGTRDGFIEAFKNGVRTTPIIARSSKDDMGVDYGDLFRILGDYKIDVSPLILSLLRSKSYPRLIRTPEIRKYLTNEALMAAMSSLTFLEASDLMSAPLKDVDVSSPYIFSHDEVYPLVRALIPPEAEAYTSLDQLLENISLYLWFGASYFVSDDISKAMKGLLKEFPLKNSAITGEAIGEAYLSMASDTPSGEYAGRAAGSIAKYYAVPVTSDEVGEEKAVDILSRMNIVSDPVVVDGQGYYSLRSSTTDEKMLLKPVWAFPIHIVNWEEDEKEFHKTAKEQIEYITSSSLHSTVTKYSLDKVNNVYYVWDDAYENRPWLIYRGTFSSIFRSSLPRERIAVVRGDDGKLQVYSSASYILNSYSGMSNMWYYNPRPGVDRSELYEPISRIIGVDQGAVLNIVEPGAFNRIRRMYKGKTYILRGDTGASPFFVPRDIRKMFPPSYRWFSSDLYTNLFPDGFPSATEGTSSPSISSSTYVVPKTSPSDVELKKAPLTYQSIFIRLPLPYEVSSQGSMYSSTPVPLGVAPLSTIRTAVQKELTPPPLSLPISTSPLYVSEALQYPPVPSGFVPAQYSNPQDFTSTKIYQ